MPSQIINRGALRFRIYTQKRDTYTAHTLAYRLNGRRHRVVRASMADLLLEVDAAETAIANGQTALLDFTAADRTLLQRLRELAGELAPLEILVAEAVDARRRNRR